MSPAKRAWEAQQRSAPFVTMDSPEGEVAIRALGGDRYQLTGPDHDSEVVGFDQARDAAHALVRGLSG